MSEGIKTRKGGNGVGNNPINTISVEALTSLSDVSPTQLLARSSKYRQQLSSNQMESWYTYKYCKMDDFHALSLYHSGSSFTATLWSSGTSMLEWSKVEVKFTNNDYDWGFIGAVDVNTFIATARKSNTDLRLIKGHINWDAGTVTMDTATKVTGNYTIPNGVYGSMLNSNILIMLNNSTKTWYFININTCAVVKTQVLPHVLNHNNAVQTENGVFINGDINTDTNRTTNLLVGYTIDNSYNVSILWTKDTFMATNFCKIASLSNIPVKSYTIIDDYLYLVYIASVNQDNYDYKYSLFNIGRFKINTDGTLQDMQDYHKSVFGAAACYIAEAVFEMYNKCLFIGTDGNNTTISPSYQADHMILYDIANKSIKNNYEGTYYNSNTNMQINKWVVMNYIQTGYSGTNYYGNTLYLYADVYGTAKGVNYSGYSLSSRKQYGIIDIACIKD